MATLNLSVLKSRQNSKGKFPVYVSVTHKRDVRYISTRYEIDDLFQFEKGKVVCRKDSKVMNQRLSYVLSEFQEKLSAIEDLRIYNCSQIKEILEEKRASEQIVTIREYMLHRIDNLKKEGREGYAEMNENTLNKTLSILGDISLQSFSTNTIDKFIRGMSGLSNATKQMKLSHLKACLNDAIKAGVVKYDIHLSLIRKCRNRASECLI